MQTCQMPGLELVPLPSRAVPVPTIWISNPEAELAPPGKNVMGVEVCTVIMPLVCEMLESWTGVSYQAGVPLLVVPKEVGSKTKLTNFPEATQGFIRLSVLVKS